jgi:hypothetical protein
MLDFACILQPQKLLRFSEVLAKGPFDINVFPSSQTRAYSREMAIDSHAAHDQIDVWIFCKLYVSKLG